MTERPTNNVAASVRQRLLNVRDTQGGDYNALLTQYAIERKPSPALPSMS